MKKHYLLSLALSLVAIPVLAQEIQFIDVVRMLRHPDPDGRLRSRDMLREAGHVEAADPIAPLIADPVDDVQLAAIETELSLFMTDDGSRTRLGFLTSRPKSLGLAAFEAGPGAMKALTVPPAVVDNLLTALNDEDDRVRFEAVPIHL